MSRVGTWTFEILLNHGLELLECAGLNIELPFQVGAHLSFHLVDLLREGEGVDKDDDEAGRGSGTSCSHSEHRMPGMCAGCQ
jgi:hypothetical protein